MRRQWQRYLVRRGPVVGSARADLRRKVLLRGKSSDHLLISLGDQPPGHERQLVLQRNTQPAMAIDHIKALASVGNRDRRKFSAPFLAHA